MKIILSLIMILTALPALADTFNIEIDYMVDTSLGSPHSHMPSAAVVAAVEQMFSCQGHTLNILVDDQLTHHDLLRIDPDAVDGFFDYSGSADTFAQLKADNFDNTSGGWHYAIFAHRYEKTDTTGTIVPSGSSGIGERPGDDFLVSMGAFTGGIGTAFDNASTLAHEFGHNLGLDHCGGLDCGSIGPNSPVLASTMSYNYQLDGVKSGLLCNELIPESAADLFKEIDYSHGRMATLNESSMSETLGTTFRSVDWNCAGGIAGTVSQDLSTDGPNWCSNSGDLNVIADYDEWANLNDVTKTMKNEDIVKMEVVDCISFEEIQERRNKAANCANPTLMTEACLSGGVFYVRSTGSPTGSGAWVDMINSVGTAQNVAPAGSALILYPGTLNEGGSGGVILNKPVRLYSATSTVIK
jgi:hypothetical protein